MGMSQYVAHFVHFPFNISLGSRETHEFLVGSYESQVFYLRRFQASETSKWSKTYEIAQLILQINAIGECGGMTTHYGIGLSFSFLNIEALFTVSSL